MIAFNNKTSIAYPFALPHSTVTGLVLRQEGMARGAYNYPFKCSDHPFALQPNRPHCSPTKNIMLQYFVLLFWPQTKKKREVHRHRQQHTKIVKPPCHCHKAQALDALGQLRTLSCLSVVFFSTFRSCSPLCLYPWPRLGAGYMLLLWHGSNEWQSRITIMVGHKN